MKAIKIKISNNKVTFDILIKEERSKGAYCCIISLKVKFHLRLFPSILLYFKHLKWLLIKIDYLPLQHNNFLIRNYNSINAGGMSMKYVVDPKFGISFVVVNPLKPKYALSGWSESSYWNIYGAHKFVEKISTYIIVIKFICITWGNPSRFIETNDIIIMNEKSFRNDQIELKSIELYVKWIKMLRYYKNRFIKNATGIPKYEITTDIY